MTNSGRDFAARPDRIALASLLTMQQTEVAQQVTAEFLERHPEWQRHFGDEAWTRGVEDVRSHISFLAGAIQSDDAEAFREYARWAAGVLHGRDVAPTLLIESLEQMRDHLARMVDPPAAALISDVVDAACVAVREAHDRAGGAAAGTRGDPAGVTSETGASGATGTTSETGASGATGATGATGASGASGAAGATGASGASDASGATAAPDTTRADGATGSVGVPHASQGGAGSLVNDDDRSLYLQAVLAGERRTALVAALEPIQRGASVADVYCDLLQPTQYAIGRLWERNQISVAREHMATAITQYVVSQLYARLSIPDAVRGNAIVTGVEGELHQLGANMVADVLEAAGWNVRFLGTQLPHRDILDAIEEHQPRIVGISATMLFSLPRVSQMVEEMRARFPAAMRIVVGGGAFRGRPRIWRDVGADGFAEDLRDGAALVDRLTSPDST